MRTRLSAALALLSTALLCGATAIAQQPPAGAPPAGARPPGPALVQMYVESSAFPDGGVVPDKYSFRGGNVQPGFKILNAPPNPASYAIIFHDMDVSLGPDNGDVLHWVVWNIPGTTTEIPEGKLPAGSVNGKGIRSNEFMGPGAPPGPRYHHYVFEFYALSAKLDLPPTASRPELLEAIKGKILAKTIYVGRFRGQPAAPGAAPAGGPPPAAK